MLLRLVFYVQCNQFDEVIIFSGNFHKKIEPAL